MRKQYVIILMILIGVEAHSLRPRRDITNSALSMVQHILRNDDLECLPRLLCEYVAGGSPGQFRSLHIDTTSLIKLLQYVGMDMSTSDSPMMQVAKAAFLGVSHRGDSYECYKQFSRCPRDQNRLLYYLNNHRGGFFKGFAGYHNYGQSRIVNKQHFTVGNDVASEHNILREISGPLIFHNSGQNQRLRQLVKPTDRLPNSLNIYKDHFKFPIEAETTYNFFPQSKR